MSVIVADMKMPENCGRCSFKHIYNTGGTTGLLCTLTEKRIWGESKEKDDNFRFYDCPLKSVEGLIEKIKEWNKFSRDEIDELYMNDILKIIKEYCGTEDSR